MAYQAQTKIAASYIRGGTSKGVFFRLQDLPQSAQQPGVARDNLLLRVLGSPDPYGKQTDGMGGATSSTSKAVILAKSSKADHDVDYLFGQVAIDKAVVDWSGNCGNLSAAVGAFAISGGLVARERIPEQGLVAVRVWQANINKTIIVQVPICQGQVQECGDFELDGVTFPAAEIAVEFIAPGDADGALFPTGNLIDTLSLPTSVIASGELQATLINAGIATIFINAEDIGYQGSELQDAINNDPQALAMFESIRAYGALQMGLISQLSEAKQHLHTPKIAFVAKPSDYVAASGKSIAATAIDLQVRALSMGKLHHAMMGTAAVAIATAGAIPGTLVNLAAGGGVRNNLCFGHPSGTLTVGAVTNKNSGNWQVDKVSMSRSARVIMEGWVRVPANSFNILKNEISLV